MADVLLVQPLGSSCPGMCKLARAGEVYVNQPFVDLAQHLNLVVESAFFKTVPFQIVKQRVYVLGVLSQKLLQANPTA